MAFSHPTLLTRGTRQQQRPLQACFCSVASFKHDLPSASTSDCQLPSPSKASIFNLLSVPSTFVNRCLWPSFVWLFSGVILVMGTRYIRSSQILHWAMDNQHSLFVFWFSFSSRSLSLFALKSVEIAKSPSSCRSLSIRASAGQQAFHFLPPTEHNFSSEIKFSVGLRFFFSSEKSLVCFS